ncbi:MAG: Major facilitator superfamily MFS_1, partial [Methanosarcinales archeaon 56_1174]
CVGRVLFIVCTSVFVEAMGYGAAVPTLPLLAPHISPSVLGLLFSMYALAAIVLFFPISWVCDHVDRRIVVMLGLACFSLASLGVATTSSLWMLFLFRALQGAGGISVWTGGLALVLDVMAQRRAGRTMGYISAAVGGGTIVGPGLGALGSPHLPFMLLAVLGAVALVMSTGLPGGVPRAAAASTPLKLAHEVPVLVLLSGVLALTLVVGMVEAHAPSYLYAFGASVHVVGGMFVVMMALYTLIQLPVGAAFDRAGVLIAVVGLLGGAVLAPLIVLLPTLTAKMVALVLTGTVLGVVFTPTIAALGQLVPSSHRGMVMGLGNLCWNVGYFAGSAGGGLLIEHISLAGALLVASLVLVLTALLYAITLKAY